MMTTEYNFRKATAAELPALKELAVLAYGQNKDKLEEGGWQKMCANLENDETYLKLFDIATCFVCEKDKQLTGMGFFIPSQNPFFVFEAGWSYIRLIGVHPAHGGRGIGRKITELCIREAKNTGEKLIALHTSEFQNAARHIYNNLGFKQMKELDPIFGKRYWLYTLDLNNAGQQIVYERATLSDLDDLIRLRIEFAIALGGEREPELIERIKIQLRSYFTKSLPARTSIWYLAKCNGTSVGAGGVMIREQPGNFANPGGIFGYVINMYTVPAFRKNGICGNILELLVKAGAHEGVMAFELHATEEGEPVYQKHDFKIHNEPTYRRYL